MEKEENKKENGILFEVGRVSNTRPTSDFKHLRVCVDYLKFRFLNYKGLDDEFIKELLKKLFVPLDSFTNEKGKAMFKVFYTFDEEIFVFGGRERERDEFGNDTFFFEMKGHALRMFELRCRNNEVDIEKAYRDVFHLIYENVSLRKIKFKRIDIAKDDFSNMITKEEYDYKFEKGFYCSSLKAKENDKEFLGSIKTKTGWSWRIGSRAGTHVMFYDKLLEREKKKEKVPYNNWLRVEARFKDEKADMVFYQLFNVFLGNVGLMETISRLIYSLVQIKEDNGYDKKDMYKARDWKKWLDFLGKFNKFEDSTFLEINTEEPLTEDIKMKKTIMWLEDVTSLAFTEYYLSNLDNFDILIANLLKKGIYKMKNKDLVKINYYRVSKGKDPLDMVTAKKYVESKIRYLENNPGNIYQNAKNFFGDDVNVVYNS